MAEFVSDIRSKRERHHAITGEQEARRHAGHIRRAGLQRRPAGAAESDRETNQAMGIWFVSRSDSGF